MKEVCLRLANISKHYTNKPMYGSNIGYMLSLLRPSFRRENKFINKKFEEFKALSNISFSLNFGQSLGIIGPNGSGKTTLMQIIADTIKPTTGNIHKKGKIAALLELGSGFNPEFTGKENVIINARILGLTNLDESKLKKILDFADIGEFIHKPISTYSSGMVLRLAFAVIVEVRPDIFIIDEALAVGDARFQLKCFSFLEKFRESGGTLILVSHDLNIISRMCNYALLLNKGELVAQGKPNDIINRYSQVFTCESNTNKLKKYNFKGVKHNTFKDSSSEKYEYSYGNKKAEIIKYNILNNKREESDIINSGEIFYINFIVKTNEVIRDPIFAITIKNIKGQQIYGQNTKFAKIILESLSHNSLMKVEFKLKCTLNSGKYFISIGLTRIINGELEVFHRRYDIKQIEVINNDGSFGLTNCFSTIEIKELENDNSKVDNV